jgi:hypothetical protein
VAKYNNNGITNGNHQALKMALDSTGNIYVLGLSANSNTNTGYVVVKYAPNGNQVWAARYDSANFPNASPVGFALDSSNNVVVTGNAVTVKYDADGKQLWMASYNARAIAVDTAQNICLTGVSSNFTTTKLSPSGENLWTTTWTYEGLPNVAEAIALDSSNNVYVAGAETQPIPPEDPVIVGLLKYDTNGNEMWEANMGYYIGGAMMVKLALDSSGGAYIEFNVAGGLGAETAYQTYGFNSSGSNVWYDGNPTDDVASFASGLTLDSMGNVLITGDYTVPPSCYGTFKIGTNGGFLWTNLYPRIPSGSSAATALATDKADSVYVTGYSTLTNADSDIATLKYSGNGNQVWVQRYDGPAHGNDAGNAIAVDNSGNVYVAGYETETNGFTSMILIKYSPVTVQKQSNGNVILQAYGSPGEAFDIQASTNLQTWIDLGDAIADTNGLVQFADTNAPSFNYRFYYTIPQ